MGRRAGIHVTYVRDLSTKEWTTRLYDGFRICAPSELVRNDLNPSLVTL
jgi:hypothetical protein